VRWEAHGIPARYLLAPLRGLQPARQQHGLHRCAQTRGWLTRALGLFGGRGGRHGAACDGSGGGGREEIGCVQQQQQQYQQQQ